MASNSSLFFNPGTASTMEAIFASFSNTPFDHVRQGLFTCIVLLFTIVVQGAVKLACKGHPQVLIHFWVGRDTSVLWFSAPQFFKKRALPLITILGLALIILETAFPTVMTQFAPLEMLELGTLVPDVTQIHKTSFPQTDIKMLMLGDQAPDSSQRYKLDSTVFQEREAEIAIVAFNASLKGVLVNVNVNSTANSSFPLDFQCVLTNVGYDRTFGDAAIQSASLALKIWCQSGINGSGNTLPAPTTVDMHWLQNGGMTNILPSFGDDIVLQSTNEIMWFKFESGGSISGEIFEDSSTFDNAAAASLTQWNSFLETFANNSFVDAIDASQSFVDSPCSGKEVTGISQCNGVGLNGTHVTFASIRSVARGKTHGIEHYNLWFVTATFNITNLVSSAPVLSSNIGSEDHVGTTYNTAWLSFPGKFRDDAYSLVLAYAVLADNSNATSPFFIIKSRPQYRLLIPLILLAVLVVFFVVIFGATKVMEARTHQKDIDYEIKYVVLQNAGAFSSNFESAHVWKGELKSVVPESDFAETSGSRGSENATLMKEQHNSFLTFGF
ncbi:hypothetical protein HDU98_003034 [Podochytrium sp. JEL0797]|nr:hypothetical protein HDU98_003034 [Podochytrium sp. JEL0797]